jgi:hypothetical protein
MALSSEDTTELLQAHIELWNQTYSFMKSVALAVALDLRIADAIQCHGGTATLSQILGEIGVRPCKLPGLPPNVRSHGLRNLHHRPAISGNHVIRVGQA